MPNSRYYGKMVEVHSISGHIKTERILKALASKSRLQILDCIQKGISNPGEIARKLGRHRSTIEKHLMVLLTANIVEKVPSLTSGGQLTIRYDIREKVKGLLDTIHEFAHAVANCSDSARKL